MKQLLIFVLTGLILSGCSKRSAYFPPPVNPPANPPGGSNNRPPLANAGPDQTVTGGLNSVYLVGGGMDPDGWTDIISYQWNKIQGPPAFHIINGHLPATVINAFTEGEYLFELTVKDQRGAAGRDTVKITVDNRIATLINNLTWNLASSECQFSISSISNYLPVSGNYEVYISPVYGGLTHGWTKVLPENLVTPNDVFYYRIRNGNMEIIAQNFDCSWDDAESYSAGIVLL